MPRDAAGRRYRCARTTAIQPDLGLTCVPARACDSRGRARWGQVKDPMPEPMTVKLAEDPTVNDGILILAGEG